MQFINANRRISRSSNCDRFSRVQLNNEGNPDKGHFSRFYNSRAFEVRKTHRWVNFESQTWWKVWSGWYRYWAWTRPNIWQIQELEFVYVEWQSNRLMTWTHIPASRPTLSQLWSSEIRRKSFLNYIKFADLLILRLWICERPRRVERLLGDVGKQQTEKMSSNFN